MEITQKNSKGKKAQMFSLTALIFIILMVSTLLIFVVMSIGYDNLSESSTLSQSSTNYGSILTTSGDAFAYSSGSSALSTLFKYEFNSSLRRTNLITNLSMYMQYLMVNGSVPTVPPGTQLANTISSMMGNATFMSYNSEVSSITGIGSRNITINQTKPYIFQPNPYNIGITYTEDVLINTSAGQYHYQIPINVSIPINNTPDLFYAQQGIYKILKFSNVYGLVTVIGHDYASSGNTIGFASGVVNTITAGSLNCNGLPSSLQQANIKKQVIIMTVNAYSLTNPSTPGYPCLNSYGGLITEQVDVPPAIPYLVFSSSSNALNLISTGQQVLIYGPGLSVLNESGFINQVSAQTYFASPFATPYLNRVIGEFNTKSPDGIFTFFGFDRQVAYFNNSKSSQILTYEPQSKVRNYSVAAWVYPTVSNGLINGDFDPSGFGSSLSLGLGALPRCNANPGSFFFGEYSYSPTIGQGVATTASYPANTWYFVVGTFNSMGGSAIGAGDFNIYLNGNQVTTTSWCSKGSDVSPISGPSQFTISPAPSFLTSLSTQYEYQGYIANMQVYKSTLTPAQVYYLYQEGIEGLPVTQNVQLIGWYPLNGNPNEYSGAGYSPAIPSNVVYSLLPNFQRDGALGGGIVPANTFPIPGLLFCNNPGQCSNNLTSAISMADGPLTISDGGLSVANFNGQTSNILIPGNVPTSNSITVSAWVKINSASTGEEDIVGESANYILAVNALGDMDADFYIYEGNPPSWHHVTSTSGVPAVSLNISEWYLLTGVFNPNSGNPLQIYINGQPIASTSFAQSAPLPLNGNPITNPTVIGSNPTSPYKTKYFNGTISNIQIYNRSLSQRQIYQMYLTGIASQPTDTYNLVGWYPLDGNSNDYSTFGNNGNVLVSMSYRFFVGNFSSAGYTPTPIGLNTTSQVVNGEWEGFGFPSPP